MTFLRSPAFLTATAITALVLAACGGGQEATSTPRPAATATQAAPAPVPTPTPAAPPTPTQAPAPVELRVSIADMPNFQMVMSDGTARVYLDALYDYVIGTTPDGKLDAKSGWATSWQSNADATVWTLKGRKGIVFHNGDPATSKDVKFGIDRMLDDKYLGTGGPIVRKDVQAVETPDDETAVFKLKGPSIFFVLVQLSRLTGAQPSHLLPKNYIESKTEAFANKTPMGSGLYKFVRSTLNDSLVLEAVQNHWLYGAPKVKGLTFRLVPEESTRVALIKSGQSDLALISRANVDDIKKSSLRVFARDDSGVGAYRIDEQFKATYEGYGKNPLADVRVRKALDWYAIDRQTIVRTFMKGLATPTMNYPTAKSDPAYEALPIPTFDPKRAKELLSEAGFGNGFEMDMYIVPRPAIPEGIEVAEAMAAMWEAVGVKVNRIRTEYANYRNTLTSGKGFTRPTAFGVWFLGNNPVAGPQARNAHKASNSFATNLDPNLDKLAEAWSNARNEEEYARLGKDYQRQYYEAGLTTVLFSMGEIWAGSSRVPASWVMGNGPYSYRIEVMAATYQ